MVRLLSVIINQGLLSKWAVSARPYLDPAWCELCLVTSSYCRVLTIEWIIQDKVLQFRV